MEGRLAAALLAITHFRLTPEGLFHDPVIPHDVAKQLTAKQIIRRFHFDHYPVPHAHGGSDHPSNLTPLPVVVHRTKTAKIDIPMIAKTKRVTAARKDFVRRVLGPVKRKKRHASRWPKRKFRRV
jgi:hypothetical protein